MKMNSNTWILVADSVKARIYNTHKASLFNGDGKKLALVGEFEHPESRKMDSELVTDRPGKFGKAKFVEATDPKRHEEEVFAIELAKNLAKAHSENHFQELIFVAPATFMGLLNKHLSAPISKLVNLRIEKDYTQCDEKELAKRLLEYL